MQDDQQNYKRSDRKRSSAARATTIERKRVRRVKYHQGAKASER